MDWTDDYLGFHYHIYLCISLAPSWIVNFLRTEAYLIHAPKVSGTASYTHGKHQIMTKSD